MAAACPISTSNDLQPWIGVQTNLRKERAVAQQLTSKGYQVYLPTFQNGRQRSDRIVTIDTPLFPGYLFCRFDPRKPSVVATPGVISLLGVGGRPEEVPEHEIASIQALVESRLTMSPHPYLRVGQTISIIKGPLKGVVGLLVNQTDHAMKVVVSITLLQRSLAVTLDREAVGEFI